MKRVILLLVPALAALLMTGCGNGGRVLLVYNWSDYIDPDVVDRFEEKFGCRVVIDSFESNEELYSQILQGADRYDILVPSSYMAKRLQEEGRLLALDHALLPNLRHVDRRYLEQKALDPEMGWSVPYMIGFTGIAWAEGLVENVEPTWGMLDRPDLARDFSLLDDMRETMGAALKYLGHSLNTTDAEELEAARKVLLRWRDHAGGFESITYDESLKNREFLLAMAYSGDAITVAEEDESIRFLIPDEGASIFCDDLVIPAAAPDPELAHAFINFLHDPEECARNMEGIRFRAPNTAAWKLVGEEMRSHPGIFPPEEVLERCEVIDDVNPEALEIYRAIWREVRQGTGPEKMKGVRQPPEKESREAVAEP